MNLLFIFIYFLICLIFGGFAVYVNEKKHRLDVRMRHLIFTLIFNTLLCPLLIIIWMLFGVPKKLYDPFLHVVK